VPVDDRFLRIFAKALARWTSAQLAFEPRKMSWRSFGAGFGSGVSMAEAKGYTHSGQRLSQTHSALAQRGQKRRSPPPRVAR
jgi:hypothetical protein